MSAPKRPGGEGGSAPPPPKRRAADDDDVPDFLDDDDGEDEDIYFDEALDEAVAGGALGGDGVRPHWRRPPLPALDPATTSVGARARPRRAAAAAR